jgi:hypothetical protein
MDFSRAKERFPRRALVLLAASLAGLVSWVPRRPRITTGPTSTTPATARSSSKDPHLSIPDLNSLGSRLDLPDGWRYKTKRLKRDLVVRARGRATVIQDDLLDTYQRIR